MKLALSLFTFHLIDINFCFASFESLDDLIIIESSSIELDDIIRLEDDSGRENGRIESEHS